METPLGELHGSVFGGRQPIVGAHLYVYQTGSGALGTASVSRLTSHTSTHADANGQYYVLTDANGFFTLTGDYTCTSGQQVYIYAVGGQPTPGVTNNAAANMAILGNCPAAGTLAGQLSFVNLNEVSTVVAAYAFAGFATDALHVSAPNNALAQTGLHNAFQTAFNLYNVQAPGSSALATTPHGNGTVPQALINSLANSIAACTNSALPGQNVCTTLFNNVKSAGATGTTATDTATWAIYLAHSPLVSAGVVSTIYKQASKVGSPYYPALTAAPQDWTIRVSYTSPGISATNGDMPHSIAVDGMGNVYATSYTHNYWNSVSPQGVPNSATGYGNNLNDPNSIALDSTSSTVWVANNGNQYIVSYANGTGTGTRHTVGTTLPFFGNVNTSTDAQLDGSGNIWVLTSGIFAYNSQLYKIPAAGGAYTNESWNSNFGVPVSLAVEPGAAGSIWVSDTNNSQARLINNGLTSDTATGNGGVNQPIGVAIDASGSALFANGDGSVTKLSAAGVAAAGSPFQSGASNGDGVAVDGDGNLWVTDNGSAVFKMSNAGVQLSSTTGYVAPSGTKPDGIAVDGSGNVWYNSSGDDSIYELVGAGAPVATPLSYAVGASKLGQRP